MRSSKTFCGIFIVLMALLCYSCEDKPRTNPFDSNTDLDPAEWAPSNLQAQVLNDSQIKLTWEYGEGTISGFQIERSENDSVTWIEIAVVSEDTTEYTDTGLSFDINYIYRVCAYASNSKSDYVISNTTSTIFPEPTNLTATAQNDSEILLEWTDNCSFEDGYWIERQDDGGNWTQIGEVAADVSLYSDLGLSYGLTYSYRVCAYTITNQSVYSNLSVISLAVVFDINGNIYQTVKIGEQWWMAENLKVTHYRNGDIIPEATAQTPWDSLTTGACGIFDDDPGYIETYGALYNWYSLNDSRGLAPEGWHVPHKLEWEELVEFLGGFDLAASKMWNLTYAPPGADNDSGFDVLPGGYYDNSCYMGMLSNAGFWSLSEGTQQGDEDSAQNYIMETLHSYVGYPLANKSYAFSVRCVRN